MHPQFAHVGGTAFQALTPHLAADRACGHHIRISKIHVRSGSLEHIVGVLLGGKHSWSIGERGHSGPTPTIYCNVCICEKFDVSEARKPSITAAFCCFSRCSPG